MRLLCIGTHHKSGTVWMRRVWHEVSRKLGVPLTQVYRSERVASLGPGPHILVNWSSTFPPELREHPEARFLHVVRDPRDMLISATRYHLKAPLKTEKFLAKTKLAWNGLTYRDMLRSLPDDTARMHFEMQHNFKRCMSQMRGFPRGHPNSTELRYEDIIRDRSTEHFRAALARLDLPWLDIVCAAQSFHAYALFGGLKSRDARSRRDRLHIRSGRAAQWRKALPRSVARTFSAHYQDVLQRYEYALDRSWVALCPEDQTPTGPASDACRKHAST